jgi:hypothetical protein
VVFIYSCTTSERCLHYNLLGPHVQGVAVMFPEIFDPMACCVTLDFLVIIYNRLIASILSCSIHVVLDGAGRRVKTQLIRQWSILASLTIISGHAINEISLDDTSYVNTTLYSVL